jgi:hypothetical protein
MVRDPMFTRSVAHIMVYNLVLYVEVPETSGLDVAWFSSPVVTLGRYKGLSTDTEAPDWTRMPTGVPIELRQPRNAIADVFSELAFWPENAAVVCTLLLLNFLITLTLHIWQPHLSPAMLHWAKAVSVSAIFH